MMPHLSYTRAACHAVYVADRVGERVRRVEASDRWPYDEPERADYLAHWLYGLARLRLRRAAAAWRTR
jgi:hypothetical protein